MISHASLCRAHLCVRVLTLGVFFGLAACASIDTKKIFEKARQGVDAVAKFPTLDSIINRAPVTTNFADATTEIAFLDESVPNHAEGFPLAAVPRDADGNYVLSSGLYEVTAESYCIQAGTHAPAKGDGYLYAPVRGPKAAIVQSILRRSAANPEISQHEVQLLLWAVIARTQLRNMPAERQQTAAALLTPRELFDLNGGALGLIPPELLQRYLGKLPNELRKVFEIEQQLRQRLTAATATYAEIEGIAVLAGLAPPGHVIRPTPGGRWSFHPSGYFVRYMPSGYQRTRIQVYIPPPITVERDEHGRIIAIDDGLLFRVEAKYLATGGSETDLTGFVPQPFKEVRVLARDSRLVPKAPDRMITRKGKGTVLFTADAAAGAEAARLPAALASRRERLASITAKLTGLPTTSKHRLAGDRVTTIVNLTDFGAAVRDALGRPSAKEAWVAAALPLLDRAAESELYATLSEKTAEDGHWRVGDGTEPPTLVAFDPTMNVAVPANTSSQRLASGGVPEGRPGERWFEKLPDCPCSWGAIPFGKKRPDKSGRVGVWVETADWRKKGSTYHPGADREARWIADDKGSGQQCTYKSGKLITAGLGAGTPDLYSPANWWYPTNWGDVYRHNRDDVAAFDHEYWPWPWLMGWLFQVDDYSCETYLRMYPPNTGAGCGAQVVSPIDPVAARDRPCTQAKRAN